MLTGDTQMTEFLEHCCPRAAQPHVSRNNCVVKRVGVVLFDGFALPETAKVVEVFQSANVLGESTRNCGIRYDVCLLSVSGGRIASSSSVFVWTDKIDSHTQPDNFDALFIAGGKGVDTVLRDERLIDWLRRIFPHTELIFPIAEGRLLLDVAGFGRVIGDVRYGERANQVVQMGLRAALPPDASSPLQAALAVVETDFGAGIAHQIAGRVELQSETRFTAIVRKSVSANVSEKIQTSARWLEMNGDRSITIDEAAQVAAMSERNFLRRFKMEMGVTPSDYLLYVRLDMCCRLLAETNLPVDKVARRCGIGSGGRLSKIFRRYLGMTPTEYRASKLQPITSV